MIRAFKNLLVGFLVSFVGSVPLGYLNIAGFELYSRFGWNSLLPYILGVVCVEAVVIYGTLVFAHRLSKKEKLIKAIEIFSIVFMFTLAVVFFVKSENGQQDLFFRKYFNHTPFVTGFLLSAVNFMALPFWMAWNLYVVHHKYIRVSGPIKLFYLFGTLLGTFCGIALIATGLDYLGDSSDFFAKKLMPYLFPVVFLLLGLWQSFAYLRKYRDKSAS